MNTLMPSMSKQDGEMGLALLVQEVCISASFLMVRGITRITIPNVQTRFIQPILQSCFTLHIHPVLKVMVISLITCPE